MIIRREEEVRERVRAPVCFCGAGPFSLPHASDDDGGIVCQFLDHRLIKLRTGESGLLWTIDVVDSDLRSPAYSDPLYRSGS